MVNLSSTSTPRSLSAELLSSRSTPSLYWCMGLFLPRCRTLYLPLLNFIRFLCAQLSSLSRSRWMAAQPSGVSTTPPSFVSSANLLRVHSNSASKSLMKKLNKTGPSTDPWWTALVTGLQVDSAPLTTTLWVLPFSHNPIVIPLKSTPPSNIPNPWKAEGGSEYLKLVHRPELKSSLIFPCLGWPLTPAPTAQFISGTCVGGT